MGNTSDQVHVYVIIIMLSTLFLTLQARSLHDHPFVHKNVDSQSLMRKLGIDISNHKQIRDIPLAPSDRLSPGGPDPQHNGRSPPSK